MSVGNHVGKKAFDFFDVQGISRYERIMGRFRQPNFPLLAVTPGRLSLPDYWPFLTVFGMKLLPFLFLKHTRVNQHPSIQLTTSACKPSIPHNCTMSSA
jgi:hypothetical protein